MTHTRDMCVGSVSLFCMHLPTSTHTHTCKLALWQRCCVTHTSDMCVRCALPSCVHPPISTSMSPIATRCAPARGCQCACAVPYVHSTPTSAICMCMCVCIYMQPDVPLHAAANALVQYRMSILHPRLPYVCVCACVCIYRNEMCTCAAANLPLPFCISTLNLHLCGAKVLHWHSHNNCVNGHKATSNCFWYQFTTGKPLKNLKQTLNYYGNGCTIMLSHNDDHTSSHVAIPLNAGIPLMKTYVQIAELCLTHLSTQFHGSVGRKLARHAAGYFPHSWPVITHTHTHTHNCKCLQCSHTHTHTNAQTTVSACNVHTHTHTHTHERTHNCKCLQRAYIYIYTHTHPLSL